MSLCPAKVYRSYTAHGACARAGTIEENGQLWCWQHAPSRIARVAREKEKAQAIAASNEREMAKRRRAEALPALLEAAKILSFNAAVIPDPLMAGLSDCYGVCLDDMEVLRAAIAAAEEEAV